MSDSFLGKVLTILVYLIIIILIPLFLDYLFSITVRNTRKNNIMDIAKEKSRNTSKPIIVFNNRYNGAVIETNGNVDGFTGDILDIIDNMSDNSCVMVVSETLEYIDSEILQNTIDQLKEVSGGDLYCINFEKNSPRILWDYKIINLMNNPFYLPNDDISWSKPNQLQRNIQHFYYYVFKILPYNFFAYDPVQS